MVSIDFLPRHRPFRVLLCADIGKGGQRDDVLVECDVEEGLRDVSRGSGELYQVTQIRL